MMDVSKFGLRSTLILHHHMHMIERILALASILLSLGMGVHGVWPFPAKRFDANAFVDAGTLGLEDAGRIVAFGDFDGDQL